MCTGSCERLSSKYTYRQCGDGSFRLKLIENLHITTTRSKHACIHMAYEKADVVRRAIYIHTPTKSRLATVAAQTAALQACLDLSHLAYQPGAASLSSLE